ncbi:MAG: tripartite tricarboxylate transporter substrate binding protein [Archangiaceae bacterium]|nr:tripartite tricarboxylate transporter substrate binding protein [Archangiaceae bacterium]
MAVGCSAPTPVDDYPNMAISMVVPGTLTGGAGLFGKAVADSSKDILKQDITLDSQSGDDGTKGTSVVTTRAADGYNTLIGNPGGMIFAPIIRKQPERKWTAVDPVCRMMGEEEFLFVKPGAPFQTFDELITYAMAHPMMVTVAGSNKGGTDNFVILLLQKAANVQFTYHDFSGGGPARTSFLAGNEDVLVGNFSEVNGDVTAGTMKPIAVASDSRSPIADVPTMKEKGYDVVLFQWRGIFVPKGTPAARIKKLADSFKEAQSNAAWTTYKSNARSLDLFLDTAAFTTYLQAEENRFAPLIAELGL